LPKDAIYVVAVFDSRYESHLTIHRLIGLTDY